MSEERDPILQKMFARADQELPGEAFAEAVMARARQGRKRSLALGAALALLAAVGVWVFAAPLLDGVNMITRVLTVTLFQPEAAWLALLLAPVNNVACLVGLGLLLLRFGYQRLFGR